MKAQNGTSLAMYPSVGFASQARGYVSKEWRFLSDAPSESLPRRLLKNCGRIFSSVSLLNFLQKNLRFGRSLAQLILAALSLYPSEVKEGPELRFLSYVPCCRFSLPTYPSVGFTASGLYWSLLAVLAWAQSSRDLWGWLMPSWGFLGPPGALFDSPPPSPHKYKAKHATK